jgi:hypothetical protein
MFKWLLSTSRLILLSISRQLVAPLKRKYTTMALYQKAFADDEDDEIDLQDDTPVVVDDAAPPEEKTWAKRYADLRRLTSKKDLKNKELEAQLEEASKSHLKLPNAEDDAALDAWMQSYPDLSRVLTRLASRQAEAQVSQAMSKVQEIEAERKQLRKATAMEQLANAHPDFFTDIRGDAKFHEWLATKSPVIQDIMYSEDNNDWKSASDVVALYKSENGIGAKKTKTAQNREVVKEVPTRSTNRPTTLNEGQFSESQIKSMSAAEYERYSDDIDEAMKTGKVVMDLSGGAR